MRRSFIAPRTHPDNGEFAAWWPGPGLKLQVFEVREKEVRGPAMSEAVLVVEVLLMEDNRSTESLIPKAKGDCVTEPGVMLGSSSMFFI